MSPWTMFWSFALVFGFGLLLGENANAGVLKYETEVTVLAGSFLGSNVFATDTAVKFTGLFDPSKTSKVNQIGDIASITPFESLRIESVGLGVHDATDMWLLAFDINTGIPRIGIIGIGSSSGVFLSNYATTSQPFDYVALAPNQFSDFSYTESSQLTVVLAVGAGNFEFKVSETALATASISAVPEPTTMAIFGLGSMLVVARRVRRARN